MVFLKKYFLDPLKRQIFRDALAQIFSLILRPCYMWMHGCVMVFQKQVQMFINVTEGGQLDLTYLEAMEVVRLKGESIKQVTLECCKRSILLLLHDLGPTGDTKDCQS